MTRVAIHPEYDAVIDLAPSRDHVPETAYALLKRTFTVREGVLALAPAEPLLHDIRPGAGGQLPSDLPLGSDFWSCKRLSDVVVEGSAHAPGGRATPRMELRCDIGKQSKRIAVFGRRHIEWGGDGKPHVGAAEPFSEMPVDNEHAYGGIDTRVPYPPIISLLDALDLAVDHPGAYPRNQDGKGYYVMPDRFDGIELPNLENPHDLLSDERLVLGAPERWGRQPIPWTFARQPWGSFPRRVFSGQRPRYAAPAAELTEVRTGILHAAYEDFLDREPANDEERFADEVFFDRLYQDAPATMQLPPLQPGVPVQVSGMRRDGSVLSFELPPAPRLEIAVDRARERVEPMISNLTIVPDEARVLVTYCARSGPLPRRFIPGIHAHIPLALHIDGGPALAYETPPLVRPAREARYG